MNGQVVEKIDAKGMAMKYVYDARHRLIRTLAPAADGGDAITRYVYDTRGNLIQHIAPNQYDPNKDTPERVDTMKGMRYQYDSMNRRIATFSPEGEGMQYVAYTKRGNVRNTIKSGVYKFKSSFHDGPALKLYSTNNRNNIPATYGKGKTADPGTTSEPHRNNNEESASGIYLHRQYGSDNRDAPTSTGCITVNYFDYVSFTKAVGIDAKSYYKYDPDKKRNIIHFKYANPNHPSIQGYVVVDRRQAEDPWKNGSQQ